MARITLIRNRTGNTENFDLQKVIAAVLHAVRAAGRRDEGIADVVAHAVEANLASNFSDSCPPSTSNVEKYIELCLEYADNCREVLDAYRELRRQREALKALAEEAPDPGRLATQIRSASTDELSHFHRARLEYALVIEQRLSIADARRVAALLEERLQRLDAAEVSSRRLREWVDLILLELGLGRAAQRGAQLSLPTFDLEQALFPTREQTLESGLESPAEVDSWVAGSLLRQFAMSRIHSPESVERMQRGQLAVCALHEPARFVGWNIECRSALLEGGGLRLPEPFQHGIQTLSGALERLLAMLQQAATACWSQVTLGAFDSALAPYLKSVELAHEAAERVLMRAAGLPTGITLRLEIDALAGQVSRPGSAPLLSALMSMLEAASPSALNNIEFVVRIGPTIAEDPLSLHLLERCSQIALRRGGVTFQMVGRRRSRKGIDLFGNEVAETPPTLKVDTAHVVINLLSPLLSDVRGDEDYLYRELQSQVEAACDALAAQEAFVLRFWSRRRRGDASPLNALGRAAASAPRTALLSFIGLEEVARAVTGNETERAARITDRLLPWLRSRVEQAAIERDMVIELGDESPRQETGRLSRLSRPLNEEAYERLVGSLQYTISTPSQRTARGNQARWDDALNHARLLHPLLDRATCLLRQTGSSGAAERIRNEILRALRDRGVVVKAIRIDVPHHQCISCGQLSPQEVATCPACGGTEWRQPQLQRSLFDPDTERETL